MAIDASLVSMQRRRPFWQPGAALVDVENSVLLNAVTAYLGVRRAEAFVELRKNNVRLLTEHLPRDARPIRSRRTEPYRRVGRRGPRLAAARSGLAAEEGSFARAREQYRATIGSYPGTLSPPPDPPGVPDSEQEARAMAREHNPQLKQVQHQTKVVDISVERAARSRLPTLSGTAGMEFNDDGDGTASVGIQLSGPIYQGGTMPSALRKAQQAQRDQVRAQLHTTGLMVDQQVSNAYSSLAVAEAGIESSEQQVGAAQLALQGVREEFQLGARASLEVLDQEQELLDAQTNRVSVEIDRPHCRLPDPGRDRRPYGRVPGSGRSDL